ncbi:MAG TPA: ABC transporter permease, partial [Thermoanaerobaculia bacterium]
MGKIAMETIRRELVHTVRGLRRSPGFTAIVLVILALGIGANTAIYSVVNAVVLRPLPYPDADRLVMLPAVHRPNPIGEEISPADFLDWRRASRSSFERLGAFGPASLNLTGAGDPERLQAAQITPGALAAIGIQPLVGRLFLPEEERADSRVALLSFALWKSHFAGDRSIVGKTVRFSGIEYPIVGVMPAEFRFPGNDVQVWIPLRFTDYRIHDRRSRWLYAVGRLKGGVSVAAAQHEMNAVSASLARQFPRE